MHEWRGCDSVCCFFLVGLQSGRECRQEVTETLPVGITWHLLEVRLEHSHMTFKLMQSLQTMTQELATLHSVPADGMPVLIPTQEAQSLLQKMTTDDDVEAYLSMFEKTTLHEE